MNKKHKDVSKKKGYLKLYLKIQLEDISELSKSEYELIDTKGFWFEALSNGDLKPTTPAHVQFIKVCKNEAKPSSNNEIAWIKFLTHKNKRRTYTAIVNNKIDGHNLLNKRIKPVQKRSTSLNTTLKKNHLTIRDSILSFEDVLILVKANCGDAKAKNNSRFNYPILQ